MRRMPHLPPRLLQHLPAWLALLAYLAAGCFGGWSLHRETEVERSRGLADLAEMEHAYAILQRAKSADTHWAPPSPKPALHLVRGGAR